MNTANTISKKNAPTIGDMSDSEQEYREIVSALPTRSPIFLPTGRISAPERLAGIRTVRDIYADRLDKLYRPQLRALRTKYNGSKRCFIIGNGPSLNQTDLSFLKDEITFAVNGFFLKLEELDWLPTFYVTEDHLVAEDRAKWINALKGSIKLFPVYLAYCLNEGPDTLFFNHLPRKSFPHGFDFSTDASDVTYPGCTVTYTCIQIAFYLGFSEIYLLGVDADYELPSDLEQADTYGVGVLDMKSDDPNHFHPDYFGKGFRWHEPQVHKMIEAYREARRVIEDTEQRIYNATIGGKLEVFERRSFEDIFLPKSEEQPRPPTAAIREPRLLVFDITPKGDGSATGELKANVFAEWPREAYMQIFFQGDNMLGLDGPGHWGRIFTPVDGLGTLKDEMSKFDPDLILYRPVPDATALHRLAMEAIADRPRIPVATWIMDDWPERLRSDDPDQFAALDPDWKWLLQRSTLRLSISDAMSIAFRSRYGFDFLPFANGVDPLEWSARKRARHDRPFLLRYAGALADNMTAASVLRVAEAVEGLAESGHEIRFEIQTKPIWKKTQSASFAHLKHSSFQTSHFAPEDYRDWLASADAALIAYNFDPASLRYIGLSMANKLPECLASGTPLLAHGPAQTATIAYLKRLGCALIVETPDSEVLKRELERLMQDPELCRRLAAKGQEVAFTAHNICSIRERLTAALSNAARRT